MSVDDKLSRISTLLQTKTQANTYLGTGFYYHRLAPTTKEGPQYRHVDNMWIVTNRHVLLPREQDKEVLPTTLTFHLKRVDQTGQVVWEEISLSPEAIEEAARFHPDKSIDVATLNILGHLESRLKAGGNYVPPFCLSADDLPGDKSVDVGVASDIIVVGYPRGFYDRVNLFPIVKAGIVASRWGMGFQGQPYFLIDAKLFPGSSGSVVLSKPNNLMVKNGSVMFAQEQQVCLLGVFSGEPQFEEAPVVVGDLTLTRKSGFDLGIVWYAELIEEVIGQGVPMKEALAMRS